MRAIDLYFCAALGSFINFIRLKLFHLTAFLLHSLSFLLPFLFKPSTVVQSKKVNSKYGFTLRYYFITNYDLRMEV